MTDSELTRLLLSLVMLLSFSLGMGHLFHHFHLPRVVGEIFSGIILGPSFLGHFSPQSYEIIFNGFSDQNKLLSVFYWLGLIMLMFSAGFDLPGKIDRKSKFLIAWIVLGGTTIPFIAGFFISDLIPNKVDSSQLAFAIVIAVASAVTSLPVLTRIFIDLKMLTSNFAKVVLTSAAIQDLILWIALSVAFEIQLNSSRPLPAPNEHLVIILKTIFFALFTIWVVPLIFRLANNILRDKLYQLPLMGYTLLTCLVLVSIAGILNINVVFSALLAGIVIGQFSGKRMVDVKDSIKNFSIWFFVPIYFAIVGLQINFPNKFNLNLFLLLFLFTSFIKIITISVFAKFASIPWLKSIDYGVAMNARGGPGIVLASLAYSAKIIDDELFLIIVLVSIVTSLIAGLWLYYRKQSILI